MTVAYPLTWPDSIARCRVREKGTFKTTLSKAIENVRGSLNLFGRDSNKQIRDVVISSNASLGVLKPSDPGVAVWFTWDGMQVCIPVDRYQTIEANLQAIHHIIEARRVELRHGTLALVRASFQGLLALPPSGRKRPWRDVFGWDGSNAPIPSLIEHRYRQLAKTRHPDAGGSDADMAELNRARDEALKEIGQ